MVPQTHYHKIAISMDNDSPAEIIDQARPIAEIRLGTQGLSATAWVGSFYPPGTKPRDFITFYAQVFDTVELNTTFYAVPRAETVSGWRDKSPDDFLFTAKFPKAITHDLRLVDCETETMVFLEAMALLQPKLGPLVVQLPPDFTAEEFDSLARFVSTLPKDFEYAVEVRNKSLHTEQLFDLLRERGTAFVINDIHYLPVVARVTADFAYIRWLGRRRDFSDEDLDRVRTDRGPELRAWANTIRDLSEQTRRIYGYVNNHYSGHAPTTVNQFKDLLEMPWIEPIQIWPTPPVQGRLPG